MSAGLSGLRNSNGRSQLYRWLWWEVRHREAAERLWRSFEDDERRQLGGDFEIAWRTCGTLGMWKRLHDVSTQLAVCDVARRIGRLSTDEYLDLEEHLDGVANALVVDAARLDRLLHDTGFRVRGRQAAERLWNKLDDDERSRLGDNFEFAHGVQGAIGMWMRLHGASMPRAVCDVARQLGLLAEEDHRDLLRHLGEFGDVLLVERAIEGGGLVLVDSGPTMYWRGERVDVEWERDSQTLWRYVWQLALHTKRGEPLSPAAFFGEHRPLTSTEEKRLGNWKHRLKTLRGFPNTLVDCIEVDGPRRQRLSLEPSRIRLFETRTSSAVVEIAD